MTAVLIAWRREQTKSLAVAGCGLLAAVSLLAVNAQGPTAFWRHASIGAGRGPKTSEDFSEAVERYNRVVVWQAEGREASVALLNSGDGLSFYVNGKSDGHATTDAGTQIMLGMLGALLHPAPKTAFIVGLGTGESAGWLADVPSIERVDVVEIEPSIREVARSCAQVNRNALDNPKVELILNDAREQMLTSPAMYDLIISEPSNPYRAGVANLFTVEFYRSVSRRLNPGGLFIQWLQAYEVDARDIAMVLETLRAEFPQVEIWTGENRDLLLVCSHDAAPLDAARLRSRLADEYLSYAIRCAWEDDRFEAVIAHYLAGGATIDALRREQAIKPVTDDRNGLEYAMARSVGKDLGEPLYDIRRRAIELNDWKPAAIEGIDEELVHDQWYYWHGRAAHPHTGERAVRLAALTAESPQEVIDTWHKQSRPPRLWKEVRSLAHAYAALGDNRATALVEQLRPTDPIAADVIAAELLFVRHDLPAAAEQLERALRELRKTPWTNSVVIIDGLMMARLLSESDAALAQRFQRILDEPFAAYFMDDERLRTAAAIAKSRARLRHANSQ
jgi:spermidine synthase